MIVTHFLIIQLMLHYSWSYLLHQLIAYYTVERATTTQTLWEYLGLTVLIFQNAALLEVKP